MGWLGLGKRRRRQSAARSSAIRGERAGLAPAAAARAGPRCDTRLAAAPAPPALRSFLPSDKPGITTAAVSPYAGQVNVTPPATGRPWQEYKLEYSKLVNNAPSGTPATVWCPANSDAVAACELGGLAPATPYRVTAQAFKLSRGTWSSYSNTSDFTTLTEE